MGKERVMELMGEARACHALLSARATLCGSPRYTSRARRQVDTFIETPVRPTEKDFLMPVEDTFSIAGRGTVVTGRIETGVIKPGDEVEIVGLRKTQKTTVTGVEMFHKMMETGGEARPRHTNSPRPRSSPPLFSPCVSFPVLAGGRQRWLLAAQPQARRRDARAGAVQAGHCQARHQVRGATHSDAPTV